MGAAQNYGTVTKQRLQRNGLINGVRAYKVEGLPDRNFDLTRENTCKPNLELQVYHGGQGLRD